MKQSLLLLCLLAASLSMTAKDNLKIKFVNADDLSPVEYVDLTVEYPDTIINYSSDRKGKVAFVPSSFPLTITVKAKGMNDGVFGLMSMPSKRLTLELTPDPSVPRVSGRRRADWSSATPRRLRSTYTVRNTEKN